MSDIFGIAAVALATINVILLNAKCEQRRWKGALIGVMAVPFWLYITCFPTVQWPFLVTSIVVGASNAKGVYQGRKYLPQEGVSKC